MSRDPSRTWLIGGGLSRPWSYAELLAESERDLLTRESSVAAILLRLTRAFWRGETIALGEPSFVGEGYHPNLIACTVSNEPTQLPVIRSDSEIQLFTSGSTGVAKPVRHTMSTLARGVVVGEHHKDDVWGLAYNPTHLAGVQVYLQALANGNTIINLWGVDDDEAFARCRKHGVTHLSGTPTFYRLFLAASPELPALRSLAIGGEPADGRLIRQLRSRFPHARVRNIYALTEAGTVLHSESEEFVVSSDIEQKVRIQDGRLWLHPSLLVTGTASTEWFDTGDAVTITRRDPLGFRIVGRVKHQWVNVGGEKVEIAEVEAALSEYQGVVVTRVQGRRNSVLGEVLVADIVFRGEHPTEPELRSYLSERLLPYQIPRVIRFVDKIELTRTGKIKRHG